MKPLDIVIEYEDADPVYYDTFYDWPEAIEVARCLAIGFEQTVAIIPVDAEATP